MSDEQLTNSQSIAETVPESVRLYLAQLQRHLALGGKVEDLQQLLELSFLRLSDRYFKFTSWPAPQHLELLVASTAPDIFPVIYSELYFRHIYARLTPTTQQRIDSWNNYLELFKWLESSIEKAPEQWTWDVIDEFVYQFQSFCVFRAKLKNKTTQDIELLKNSTQVWSSTQVISVLEKLSGLSRSSPLSLFATIGLVRVRCMLGEFESALKTLDGWDLSLVGRFVSVQLSLAFYVSFAYFILHRYSDAIRYLSNVLLLIARVDLRAKTYQYEQTVKKLEQLIALLAMSSALGNQPIDESLRLVLRDKFSDAKLGRLQRGEVSAFEELFCFASPKFVVVTPPPFDADPTINYTHELLKEQIKKVQQQAELHGRIENVRSVLRLYNSISVSKLARLLDTDESNILETLELLKASGRQIVWKNGSLASGELIESNDIEFVIENGTIKVEDKRKEIGHSEYFRSAINRLQELIGTN